MLKVAVAGATVLLITASSPTYAQTQTPSASTPAERMSANDVGTLTDARILIAKGALQLTPEQEKYWPAIEKAIRTRAKDRQARVDSAVDRMEEMGKKSPVEVLRERNPIDFLHRRAEALSQRSTDLKNLADAWQPLYQTLTPEQKQRLGFVTMVVLRDMRNAVEQYRLQAEDEEEE